MLEIMCTCVNALQAVAFVCGDDLLGMVTPRNAFDWHKPVANTHAIGEDHVHLGHFQMFPDGHSCFKSHRSWLQLGGRSWPNKGPTLMVAQVHNFKYARVKTTEALPKATQWRDCPWCCSRRVVCAGRSGQGWGGIRQGVSKVLLLDVRRARTNDGAAGCISSHPISGGSTSSVWHAYMP